VSAPPDLVTLHVWRIPPGSLPRALARMALDPRRLRATAGVRFGKLLGTGGGVGFGPADVDPTRWAALVVWSDPAHAAGFDETPVGRAWRRIASGSARIDLRPLASRGRWSRVEPFGPYGGGGTGPARPGGGRAEPPGGTGGAVLALTRARLRPRRAVTFWRAVPPVAAGLRAAPGLLAGFGIGEAPVGWQGTVSVWRNATDLVNFAYRHPGHRAAIMRTPAERWYAEELFARFQVDAVLGDRAVLGWVGYDGGRQ
jgi:hypothetical protein